MRKPFPSLIVILGPTASGKTELALKLAKKYNGEIICADSRTVYREMNIGTAKPGQNEKLKMKNEKCSAKRNSYQKPIFINHIPHYLIDVVKPDQKFSVAEFKQKTLKIIKGVHQKNKIPFLVGGTGLYISAVVDNLDIPKVPPDKKLREKLENNIKKYGLNYLWGKLIKLDSEAANFVQKQNPRRIIRALEVCLKTKKTFSELRKKGEQLLNVLQIGIKIPFEKLEWKIGQRTDQMIENGLIEETENLIKKYSSSPLLNTIGYQEIVSYLQNKISLDQAISLIKKNTRRYARRQMTWFKRDKRIHWIKNQKEAERLLKNFLRVKTLNHQ